MHVGGLTQVSRCSPMMGTLFMQSGTCNVPKNPDVKQFAQPRTLLQCQSGQMEVSRSLNHVLQFPCREIEGKNGRCYVFSRWQVSGGSISERERT